MILRIDRIAHLDPWGTLGHCYLHADDGAVLVSGYTVELPWRDNAVGESCIPPGVYRAIRHDSPIFGSSLWLQDVPGRTEILVHPANAPHQLDGCIAPGESWGWAADHRPWADRREFAVWSSQDTLDRILDGVPDEIDIDIRTWMPAYP